MQDSVLVVALDEAKTNADALGDDSIAGALRRRIRALEAALTRLETPRPKEAVVRLALHALALRDESASLRSARELVLAMMD